MSFDTNEQYSRVEDEFVAAAEPDDETEEELKRRLKRKKMRTSKRESNLSFLCALPGIEATRR